MEIRDGEFLKKEGDKITRPSVAEMSNEEQKDEDRTSGSCAASAVFSFSSIAAQFSSNITTPWGDALSSLTGARDSDPSLEKDEVQQQQAHYDTYTGREQPLHDNELYHILQASKRVSICKGQKATCTGKQDDHETSKLMDKYCERILAQEVSLTRKKSCDSTGSSADEIMDAYLPNASESDADNNNLEILSINEYSVVENMLQSMKSCSTFCNSPMDKEQHTITTIKSPPSKKILCGEECVNDNGDVIKIHYNSAIDEHRDDVSCDCDELHCTTDAAYFGFDDEEEQHATTLFLMPEDAIYSAGDASNEKSSDSNESFGVEEYENENIVRGKIVNGKKESESVQEIPINLTMPQGHDNPDQNACSLRTNIEDKGIRSLDNDGAKHWTEVAAMSKKSVGEKSDTSSSSSQAADIGAISELDKGKQSGIGIQSEYTSIALGAQTGGVSEEELGIGSPSDSVGEIACGTNEGSRSVMSGSTDMYHADVSDSTHQPSYSILHHVEQSSWFPFLNPRILLSSSSSFADGSGEDYLDPSICSHNFTEEEGGNVKALGSAQSRREDNTTEMSSLTHRTVRREAVPTPTGCLLPLRDEYYDKAFDSLDIFAHEEKTMTANTIVEEQNEETDKRDEACSQNRSRRRRSSGSKTDNYSYTADTPYRGSVHVVSNRESGDGVTDTDIYAHHLNDDVLPAFSPHRQESSDGDNEERCYIQWSKTSDDDQLWKLLQSTVSKVKIESEERTMGGLHASHASANYKDPLPINSSISEDCENPSNNTTPYECAGTIRLAQQEQHRIPQEYDRKKPKRLREQSSLSNTRNPSGLNSGSSEGASCSHKKYQGLSHYSEVDTAISPPYKRHRQNNSSGKLQGRQETSDDDVEFEGSMAGDNQFEMFIVGDRNIHVATSKSLNSKSDFQISPDGTHDGNITAKEPVPALSEEFNEEASFLQLSEPYPLSKQPMHLRDIVEKRKLMSESNDHDLVSSLLRKVQSYDAQTIAARTRWQLNRTAISYDRFASSLHSAKSEYSEELQHMSPKSEDRTGIFRGRLPVDKSLFTTCSNSPSASSSFASSSKSPTGTSVVHPVFPVQSPLGERRRASTSALDQEAQIDRFENQIIEPDSETEPNSEALLWSGNYLDFKLGTGNTVINSRSNGDPCSTEFNSSLPQTISQELEEVESQVSINGDAGENLISSSPLCSKMKQVSIRISGEEDDIELAISSSSSKASDETDASLQQSDTIGPNDHHLLEPAFFDGSRYESINRSDADPVIVSEKNCLSTSGVSDTSCCEEVPTTSFRSIADRKPDGEESNDLKQEMEWLSQSTSHNSDASTEAELDEDSQNKTDPQADLSTQGGMTSAVDELVEGGQKSPSDHDPAPSDVNEASFATEVPSQSQDKATSETICPSELSQASSPTVSRSCLEPYFDITTKGTRDGDDDDDDEISHDGSIATLQEELRLAEQFFNSSTVQEETESSPVTHGNDGEGSPTTNSPTKRFSFLRRALARLEAFTMKAPQDPDLIEPLLPLGVSTQQRDNTLSSIREAYSGDVDMLIELQPSASLIENDHYLDLAEQGDFTSEQGEQLIRQIREEHCCWRILKMCCRVRLLWGLLFGVAILGVGSLCATNMV